MFRNRLKKIHIYSVLCNAELLLLERQVYILTNEHLKEKYVFTLGKQKMAHYFKHRVKPIFK
jgi:hypothetical protein